MRSGLERVGTFANSSRARNAKRMRSSGLIAVLLALLLWQTKWPSLRLGLIVLLLSYLGSALLLLYRNKELSRDVDESELRGWFDREQGWAKGMMLFENISRTAGFMALGYGFWVPTGSVGLAILLGVVYPTATYFGLERRSYERRMRALQVESVAGALKR